MSECSDPDRVWYPQRSICYPTMATAQANAEYERLHAEAPFHDGTFREWAKEPSEFTPYRFNDGVTIWVSDQNLTPEDPFLTAPGDEPMPGSED